MYKGYLIIINTKNIKFSYHLLNCKNILVNNNCCSHLELFKSSNKLLRKIEPTVLGNHIVAMLITLKRQNFNFSGTFI